MEIRSVVSPFQGVRIGLDAEALSGPEWFPAHQTRLAICFGFGTADNVGYVQAKDMTAGVFDEEDLMAVAYAVAQPGVIVVAHNANYDLDLLNGTLLDHGLDPLPSVQYQDTMNTLKTGRAFRRTLKDRCAALGVNLKGGSPNWRDILQRKPAAWSLMRDYNINDVICTLQLERAYAAREQYVPIKTWHPRRPK